eukprot:1631239-Pyramimonas_sp.AAC.1
MDNALVTCGDWRRCTDTEQRGCCSCGGVTDKRSEADRRTSKGAVNKGDSEGSRERGRRSGDGNAGGRSGLRLTPS